MYLWQKRASGPQLLVTALNCFSAENGKIFYNEDYVGSETQSRAIIDGVDAATFVELTPAGSMTACWAKDMSHVYYGDRHLYKTNVKIVDGADSETFEVSQMYEQYTKDATHVYFSGLPQKVVADVTTFVALNNNYAKDGAHVYAAADDFSIAIVKGADPKTFETTDDYHSGKDATHSYYDGDIVEKNSK